MKKQCNFSRNSYRKYWVNDVIQIDNESGFGVTSDHRAVAHKGFFNRMPASMFFSLACRPPDASKVSRIVDMVEEGAAVASPTLYIDIDGFLDEHSRRLCKVVGCEGVSTCAALQRLGVDELHFPFILLGRTLRDVGSKSDFFNWLSHGIVPVEGRVVSMPINKTLV
jgi:hypothetical protein